MTQQVAIDRNRMYTPPQAAQILGCSEDRVRRLCKTQRLKGIPVNENAHKIHWKIPGGYLDDFMHNEKRKARKTKTVEIPDFGDMFDAIDELRNDMNTGDAALIARIDIIESRLNKAIYDLWLSHVCTLDAFSDCFVPFMNSKANSLRLGAEFDAKFAGFKIPPKEERKKLMENRTQN